MDFSFQYPSRIHEIPRIRKDMDTLEKQWKIPASKMKQIRVIVEELFSNIVRFAFDDQNDHFIELKVKKHENLVRIEIIDDGKSFNPLEENEEPLRDPAMVESGGMGIALVQTFSNSMSYSRIGDKNHLIIEKKI